MQLTDRFTTALTYATELHALQLRKGSEIPYVAHLLAVSSLVLEAGGDEDEAIAALLHDAVEDQGGAARLEQIRGRYGDRVADLVWACSDTDTVPKPPWQERKQAYLDHLETADEATLRVSCADKVHNARSIATDMHELGEGVFDRFSASAAETRWYYEALAEVFERRLPGRLSGELTRAVAELADQTSTATPSASN